MIDMTDWLRDWLIDYVPVQGKCHHARGGGKCATFSALLLGTNKTTGKHSYKRSEANGTQLEKGGSDG